MQVLSEQHYHALSYALAIPATLTPVLCMTEPGMFPGSYL